MDSQSAEGVLRFLMKLAHYIFLSDLANKDEQQDIYNAAKKDPDIRGVFEAKEEGR
jgi:hypothetical protein